METHPLYFLNACYWSFCERFIHVYFLFIYLFWACSFWLNYLDLPVKLLSNVGLQLFSPLHPFLTIDCKLAFRVASIQSTTNGLNQIPALYFSLLIICFDVCHKLEEKSCIYLHSSFKDILWDVFWNPELDAAYIYCTSYISSFTMDAF